MTVVAEGVETESQLSLLKDLGCQLVQGYYFSAPLHPSDFEDRFFRREER
jgi:EAL domain-containing protein (putative c-di-GMP-specific phosphodiesterase class I)